MKVISRTLLVLATGVAGGMTPPAFAAPGVHLVTSIETLSHGRDGVHYAVTVRPVGGPAHAATLVLSTRRPAAWTTGSRACLSSADRTALACDLGDVRESERRTLRVTANPGDGPAQVPVIAQAGAANAPSVTSSLGLNRPAALRFARDEPPPPVPEPSPEPSEEPSPSASATAEVPPPADSASAAPSEDFTTGSPAVVLPQRPSPVARPRAPHRAPAPAPSHAPAPVRPPAAPHAAAVPPAPVIPHQPVPPAAVPAASPPPNAPLGGPPVLPSMPSPALPQVAPHASQATGISELETLSPAGAMQAGRTSWVTLIATAVAAEAGLLWLIAGFTVWRRKRSPRSGRRPRVPARLIP